MSTSAAELRRRARRLGGVCVDRLIAEKGDAAHWTGELSTSALSTATAVVALWRVEKATGLAEHRALIDAGLDWLAAHQNDDGGWGDTTRSQSNLSTTTLAWSAFPASRDADVYAHAVRSAEEWIERAAGSLEPAGLAEAIGAVYGEDRTFSVPILTLAALCGRLGAAPDCWRLVRPLPFELAALPMGLFRFVGLPVVSYALPALIAIGRVRHHALASRNPIARLARRATEKRTLHVLESIQPTNGGFLEAIPLTSFVVLSLAATGDLDNEVLRLGVAFITKSVREDGSWPIDTNLATWVTTLSVEALAASGELESRLTEEDRRRLLEWLLAQQYTSVHRYTNSPPGAWAWTDLPGGVPDADDTAGALLALSSLGPEEVAVRKAAERGLTWLLDLQNRDGGTPTFCRGWGKLPFDRSGTDLTAHTLRAYRAWEPRLAGELCAQLRRAAERSLGYLRASQSEEGCWRPLWFGNEAAADRSNPVYGTSRVLRALELWTADDAGAAASWRRGVEWLLEVQHASGGWGGDAGIDASLEETALALDALAGARGLEAALPAIHRGLAWLETCVERGGLERPAPIGFYFANLWYHEALYPIAFSVSALGRIASLSGDGETSCATTPGES